MKAVDYVAIVTSLLPPSPELQALNEAATTLDAAVAASADLTAPSTLYRQRLDAVKRELIDAMLKAVPIQALRDAAQQSGVLDDYQLHAEAQLGPLFLALTTPSARLADPTTGQLVAIGPMPPNAFQARLDAGPVRGDGTLVIERDHLGGLLSARVGTIEVAVLASLARTGSGGPAFLAVLSAGFTPGLQLGFGFQVSRVGGIIGIERSLDPAAIARGLKDGTAAAVLFPLDAGNAARAALAAAEQMFPPTPGSAVAGPTFRLSWLEVAGQGFVSADLAVLVQLPGPRIVLIGSFRAGIPGATALLHLRADVAGILDFPAQRATVDASLVDSGVLGIFTVYGDLAFATSWGPTPYMVLSIGGFFPGYRPEPAQIRPLSRLGMALNFPLPGLTLRAEGYLAATSNTLQIGGRLDVGIDAGIAGVFGFLGVDAMIQFSPFHFTAEACGGLEVEFLGETFCGVRFDGRMDGPGPVTLHGKVTVETFFKDFEWEDTFVFGEPDAPPGIPAQRAAQLLKDEEFTPNNLRAVGGIDPSVQLSPPDRQDDFAVVAPLSGLAWAQHRVPFNLALDRVDGTPLGSVQTVRATAPNQTGVEKDRFAPGSYLTLSRAQALATPTYDELPAGLTVGAGPALPGNSRPGNSAPKILRKVRGKSKLTHLAVVGVTAAFPAGLLDMTRERDQRAKVADDGVRVTFTPPPWHTTADGGVHQSATQAVRSSILRGGAAVTDADLAQPVALQGL